MAISIVEDMVGDARFRYTPYGAIVIRSFLVEGLTPSLDLLAAALTATDAVTGHRIPMVASPHPTQTGIYATDFDAEPFAKSRTKAKVNVIYRTPEFVPNSVSIRISGSNGMKLQRTYPPSTTNRLVAGKPIVIGYNPLGQSFPQQINAATVNVDASKNGGNYYDIAAIPVLSPGTILEFTRREPTSPLVASQVYRRTVNKTKWQLGAAHVWLCRGVDAQNITGVGAFYQNQWEVRYTFEYDPDGWERVEFFKNPHTGKPPPGIDTTGGKGLNNGYMRVLPYREAEFSALKLPNAF